MCAWAFGDSFDLYAATSDGANGYWDIMTGGALVAGRFAGGQALQMSVGPFVYATKTSAVNDAVHHLVCAFRQTAAISGSTLGAYLQLLDGTTGQCCVVFRSDGAILLTSGTPAGTVLDTYTGAVTTNNTWFAFEFEVVINNTTGSWAVRKNGNTSNDRALGSLNTRGGTANNYANKLTAGMQVSVSQQQVDDLYWRSDAASVPWMGDIRCYTRMPASDQSVQFSRTPTVYTQSPFTVTTTLAITNGVARYSLFTAAYDGTVGSATVTLGTGYTGNMKCSIFASSGTAPTTVLGSATPVTNPATGSNTFTFGTPVAVTKGTQYYLGFDSDTTSGTFSVGAGTLGFTSTTAYASFPTASPTVGAGTNPAISSLIITVGTNNCLVNEAQQDTTSSYVYDSTPGDADFYGIAAIASTPVATIAVTTRAYMQKSDAGTRTAAVQLKSGSATVASSTLTLTTSGWLWAWRLDTVDPNTSAAWSPAAVNNAQVGPKTIA